MSDATGFGTGGTSELLTVGLPVGSASCDTSSPVLPFVFSIGSALQQCGTFNLYGYDGATLPVTITGFIPGGESIILYSGLTGTSYNWTPVNVAAGTTMIFSMTDARGQTGGDSDITLVASSNDASCLNANSPSSTASLAPSSTSASATQSATQTSSSSSGASIGVIAGAVAGGVIAILALGALALFCIRRRRYDCPPQSSSARILHRADSEDLGPGHDNFQHAAIHPFPYQIDSISNLSPPIGPGSTTALSYYPETSPGYPSLRPSVHTGTDSFPSSPRTQTHSRTFSNSGNCALAGVTSYQPATRFVVHTDAEDVVPPDNSEVIELPPQYSERLAPAASLVTTADYFACTAIEIVAFSGFSVSLYVHFYFFAVDLTNISTEPVVLVSALAGSAAPSGWAGAPSATAGAGPASYPLATARSFTSSLDLQLSSCRMRVPSGAGHDRSMFDAGSQFVAKEGAGANVLSNCVSYEAPKPHFPSPKILLPTLEGFLDWKPLRFVFQPVAHLLKMRFSPFFRSLISFASYLSAVQAFNVTVGTPTQCGPLTVTWTGGQPPFNIVLTPLFDIPRNESVPSTAFNNNQGSYEITQLPFFNASQFVLTMSDATGFGTGGLGGASCNTSSPALSFTFSIGSVLQQCGAFILNGYDGATLPVTITGFIPGGESIVLYSGLTGTSYTWTPVNVAGGTTMIFSMTDARGQTGGDSGATLVAPSNDASCLNANSPSSTASLVPSSTSASATQSATQTSSSSSGASIGVIAGAVAGGVIAILALGALALFCIRRRRYDRPPQPASARILRRVDSEDLSPGPDNFQHAAIHPFPYQTDSISNLLPPIGPGSTTALSYYPETSSGYPSLRPSVHTGTDSFPSSPRTQTHSRAFSNTESFGGFGEAASSSMSSSGRRKAAMAGVTGYQPVARFVVHTDAEDVVPSDNSEVIELPPQYSERLAPAASLVQQRPVSSCDSKFVD
ncbi:hypothetical protein BU15DRAFT_76033 [Melanogaster broomeanus]|nr:hypothetical protein BU15DRAFT_76033 [Melanogaster broomeanus]